MEHSEIINWLLEGDVSIQFQTYRDLLDESRPDLQNRIATEGWGAQFLNARDPKGFWGRSFYQPKWTSTHYTLLDLKHLGISPDNSLIQESLNHILTVEKGKDGGINPVGSTNASDLCINGMALNYASYFRAPEEKLHSVIDFILSNQLTDGGFNCRSVRKKVHHSSLHTSLSILEGFQEYINTKYTYRLDEIKAVIPKVQEFILMHRLFISDRTGEIINENFLKLCYPGRWYYDILKALDYFQSTRMPYDDRMLEALSYLETKRLKDGKWKLASPHPGQVHFNMEKAGQASRWNTLRALRVLKSYLSNV
jgi:hypothetical protein